MKSVEFHRWFLTGPTGKRYKTRHVMTREDALEQDPTAEPVPNSKEVRELPATPEEIERSMNPRGKR